MLVSKENSSSCSTLKVLLSLPSLVEDIVKLQECYRVFHYKKVCKKKHTANFKKKLKKSYCLYKIKTFSMDAMCKIHSVSTFFSKVV